ncbi:S1C family serine protease [Anaeromyxobacter paludicola]|uniref:PDZ domain-containing protein n=1 Tax=Anaeromyxobacter paludicola TaxID=2918171 RepID=A0ABM7XE98_9BACT|nr:trypsin-like peptidase domain-containing protein [Anaeromyxobacter paludicola]BDG10197.1 hypothetical protein AMPC_33100 [Anaeromyxobacter paludicola]
MIGSQVLASLLLAAAPAPAPSPARAELLRGLDAALVHVTDQVAPAVVQLQVTGYGGSDPGMVVLRRAIGSGVIVDPSGYVVTNAHVVAGARRIRVLLAPAGEGRTRPQKREYVARVVGAEPEVDLALLKIDATDLPYVALSDRDVRPGQLVFAIGSPVGLANSVTLGVISSVARTPDPSRPQVFVQTDAPINPGNSGGPLVDTEGRVVGINTSILSKGGGSEGLGFAIPSSVVRVVTDALRKMGHLHHAVLGVSSQEITPGLAAGLGLSQDWGVLVSDVVPGSPAARAGVAGGDLLRAVDGRPVDGMPALNLALYLHPAGSPVALSIQRGKERLELKVVGAESSHPADLLGGPEVTTRNVAPLGVLGVTLDDRVRALLPPLREPAGVVVAARTLAAAELETGLEAGDVIHAVNRTPVASVDELAAALAALRPAGRGVLRVERRGVLVWLELDLDQGT